MFTIVITEKGGAQHQLDFAEAEVGIGRLEDNALCLPKNNVSKHHARLLYKDDRYVIVDQQSTNGTYVNGRRISGPSVVRRGDKIYIGDFILTLAAPRTPARASAPTTADPAGYRRTPHPPLQVAVGGGASAKPSGTTETTGLPEELRQQTRPGHRTGRTASGASSPAPAPLTGSGPAAGTPTPVPRSGPPPLPPRPPSRPNGHARPSEPALSHVGAVSAGAPNASNSQSSSQSHSQSNNQARARPAAAPLVAATPTQPAPRRLEPAASASIPPLPALRDEESAGVDSAQAAATAGLTSPAVLAPSVRLQNALSLLMERLAPHLDIHHEEESAFPGEHQVLLDTLIHQLAEEGVLAQDLDRAVLRDAAINEAVGLGPLERLLTNRQVREVVVDGPTRVLADLGGGLTPLSSFFSDDGAVLVVAGRLLQRAGQKLDRERAIHEAQLPGGGTLQLLLPPLSPRGPLLSVRCPSRGQRSPDSYVAEGTLSADMLSLLRGSLQQRRNILVLGSASAGVSDLLFLLTRLAPDHERIVTIEESPSASLLNPQALPLCRRALPDCSLHELLQRAAQLRPDRLLIDDLRLDEASGALLAAAGSGGVLMGMHAPDPMVALSLLTHSAGLTLGGNPALSTVLLVAALQLVVHVGTDSAGLRRVLSIQELHTGPGGVPELRPKFRLENGSFVASFLGR